MQDAPDLTAPPTLTKAQRWLHRLRRVLPFAATVLFTLAAVFIYAQFNQPAQQLSEKEIDARVLEVMQTATPQPAYSAGVFQFILPSLVYIQTQGTNPSDLFGLGVGTGVVVNDAGGILTALHVVDGATEINVIFADGTEATAIVETSDPANDIAVLLPSRPPELLVPATLGNPAAMNVGDEAYAVGNPLGLSASMSAGVISGFERSIPIAENGQRLDGLIQFDTAVNPGNSGGPLLNRAGQVVGIVTALANPSEQNTFIGIGFAVPIGTAGAAAGAPQY